MGSLFAKSKKPSRVTEHDKAVLKLKQQRDRLKQYQKRIELSLERDRELAKKCLHSGRKDRAKLLLRKKKFQESVLSNTDKQLENLEKMTVDLEFAQVELQVIEGLKQGNAALKRIHDVMDINEIEKIMDETREGIEKQQELDALLTDALTPQDEDDVMAELEALVDEEAVTILPDVPANTLPEAEEVAIHTLKGEDCSTGAEDDGERAKRKKTSNESTKRVLVEA